MRTKKTPQARVLLFPAGGGDVANVWADIAEGGFRLQHDYPDCRPAPGWHLESGGVRYEITAVDGRALTCAKLEVPA